VAAIGVVCARVRVEEKQIIAALTDAGAVAMPVPPAPSPLPPSPTPPAAVSGIAADYDMESFAVDEQAPVSLLIDRCQNRAIAETVLPIWRAQGLAVLDAGLAATGTRLQVVQALASAGLPRPATLLACTEETALAAVGRLGYPATLLPLTPGSATAPLYDRDTAEAVVEHRVVLGDAHEAISLIQAGVPRESQRLTVHVVGGQAVAVDETTGEIHPEALRLAERAALALDAAIIAVEVVNSPAGPVVWDVQPIAEFRRARALGDVSLAEAIARLALPRVAGLASDVVQTSLAGLDAALGGREWEVRDGVRGVALSA
jgi:[lysine-biosynthesis-protein LysW]---L-2-aminoadipate ligase